MKIANISTIKNELSKYLRYVREGETVRILDRDKAIADIVPVQQEKQVDADEAFLRDQEARGIIKRRGTGRISKDFFTRPRPHFPGGESGVLAALLEERKEGR